jgi:3-hydroxyisobutyrate dehydrogenase-like beta-hydroxyacid dehydrogenase
MSQSIGFIGLGSMRQPMERTLLKADHRVTVYNHSETVPGRWSMLALLQYRAWLRSLSEMGW